MNYCRSCVLPDARPNLVIGDDGVCNACRNHRRRKDIDWRAREHDFRAVVADARARSTGYDCVIPVSGGKDSTWQVVTCRERVLNPLCVTWNPPLSARPRETASPSKIAVPSNWTPTRWSPSSAPAAASTT